MSQGIQLLCSTGALSRFPVYTGYEVVLKYGHQLDVDGFELMFYPGWYTEIEDIASTLRKSGLAFPAMHSDKNIGAILGKADTTERRQGVEWLEANCQLGALIGTRVVVLHLWGWPELDDDLDRNLSMLGQCLDIAERYELTLALETIPCRKSTPLNNIFTAIERDKRSQVALDTEFLAGHHQLTEVFLSDWLWQEPQVQHVHIKDYDAQPFTADGKRRYLHPGEGTIDFTQFFEQLKEKGFNGNISLESPVLDQNGNVDMEKLLNSIHYLRERI